ncbi:MAG: PEP-CTERM sorting domain-containing protein [Verrucomicrobia bacterium]|nr:MAG: PEP-CTERM sorting domain-containing protein [Verrucomicrobiota bacterium]
MKCVASIFCMMLGLVCAACAQGTFSFDQQSSTESTLGEGAVAIQTNQPLGQSFTPTFDSLNFIRLYLLDGVANGSGATVLINLRTNSITGPILSSTDPVALPDHFAGATNFFFPVSVPLSPGVLYYFQPVLQSGDSSFTVNFHNGFGYTGGNAFFQGTLRQFDDLWFREGTYNVPEPSSVGLVLIGFGALFYRRKRIA